VFLRIEPLARGEGFDFVDDTVGGSIPNQYLPAIEKGVRQVLDHGAVAGYVLQDVRVIVYDGKHHPVDSKEVAFVSAGKKAFLDAIGKARPMVLEPIVNLDVEVPDHCMGDVTGGLATKRARINGTDAGTRWRNHHQGPGAPGRSHRLLERTEGDQRRSRPLRHRVQSLRGGAGQYPEAVDGGVQAAGGGRLTAFRQLKNHQRCHCCV
jgi:translation elongation factor EF-G